MLRRLRAVVPPARIPHALKERRRVPVDEVHVAADGFVEQLEDAIARMVARHSGEGVGEGGDQGEDHPLLPRSLLILYRLTNKRKPFKGH